MPDNDEPANNGPESAASEDEEIRIPRIAQTPELPHPPEIEYHRPRLTLRGNEGASESANGSSAPEAIDSANIGRLGAGLSIGLSFGLTIVVCIGLGMLLDKHVPAIRPWGTIVLSVLGIVVAFTNLIRLANSLSGTERP